MSSFVQEGAVCFQSRMSEVLNNISLIKDVFLTPGIAFTFYRI